MSKTSIKCVQLWEKDLVVPLFTGLKLAPGTDEYSKCNDTSVCMSDHSLGGIPFFNPSIPKENVLMQCSHCKVSFDSRMELISHFNEEWHIVNLQRRLNSLLPIDLETFNSRSNLDEEVDVSTDSESDDDDIVMKKTPRIYFTNSDGEVLSIFRCLLMAKNKETSEENIVLHAMGAIRKLYWCIVLMSGGHFAGAVYRGSEVIAHKTFHSYTVRAKQGGSQSSRDNKCATSHPKSAGASLRRYNERSFAQHVEGILILWKEHFKECHLIFLQCSASNKQVLFGQSASIISKEDPRIRSIPIITKKPTMSEVKKVQGLLGQVLIHGNVDEFAKFVGENDRKGDLKVPTLKEKKLIDRSSPKKENVKMSMAEKSSLDTSFGRNPSDSEDDPVIERGLESLDLNDFGDYIEDRKKRRKRKEKEICNTDLNEILPVRIEPNMEIIQNHVYTACRLGEIFTMKALVELERSKNFCEIEDTLSVDVINALGSLDKSVDLLSFKFGLVEKSLLHIAAANGQKDIIWWLLDNGCDPCETDQRKKTPYMVSSTKEVKCIFRKFRGEYPERYDYIKAHIPDPISIETEKLQKKKIDEKKKKHKILKVARQKEKKKEEIRLQQEEIDKQKYLQLSDREKRALAAERRISQNITSSTNNIENKDSFAILKRCFQCGEDISTIVPFEYSNNKFCSTSCVRLHRLNAQSR